jgi:hypothetical protein
MKVLTAILCAIFGILLLVYCALQCYIRPIPSTVRFENVRTHVDGVFWNAWVHENPRAQWLYSHVFPNSDKSVFFPPRITTEYDDRGRCLGYMSFGMVTTWDAAQKLLTLSSYFGGTLYVRFDPDAYGQTATLPVLDMHGSIDTSKGIQIVKTTSIPNEETLFCSGDVLSIETSTWQELFSTTPTRPVIPKTLMLSFRLCQNKP